MGLDEIYHICVDQNVKMPHPRKCRWGHVPPLPPPVVTLLPSSEGNALTGE